MQLLKAAGCRVIGLDINEGQFARAREFGADRVAISGESAADDIVDFTRGVGADAVILTASTSSNAPMQLAIDAARKRGRVVVVGVSGMDIPRSPFYEKELEITIACSYGPGRYDPTYEEGGHDYPIAFVRWTEGRNMEAVLDLIDAGRLDVKRMITHRIPISEASRAYDMITGKTSEKYIGIVLTYPEREADVLRRNVRLGGATRGAVESLGVSFIGAGNFAQSFLLPPVKESGARLVSVMTSTSVNARTVAERFGFEQASTDLDAVLGEAAANAVFIATHHDTHGEYVARALEAGRQVFVEKPLAISREELARIVGLVEEKDGRVMVGFNRRFSAPLIEMKRHIGETAEPKVMLYRVNAGFIKPESWVQSEAQGGRIIGEGCHFIDCMQFITDARPVSVYAAAIGSGNVAVRNADNVSITIRFSDGSVGTLLYLANGDASIPKEYFEVFCGGRTAIMDNFKSVRLASDRRTREKKFNGQKGHAEEVKATVEAMRSGGAMPISFESLVDTTVATFAAMESLATGGVVEL